MVLRQYNGNVFYIYLLIPNLNDLVCRTQPSESHSNF